MISTFSTSSPANYTQGPELDLSISMSSVTDLLSTTSEVMYSNSTVSGLCASGWLPTNHMLFQMANTFLFLSYLAPAGIHGILFLRICLTVGSFFFALWGWIVLCALDTLIWNAIFTAINFVHMCIILYLLRPVHFSHEIELVYRDLFQPLRVSRQQFKSVLKCMKEVQVLKPKDSYSIEKVTRADRLTLVLSGRLVVSQHGHTLHVVDSHQFLDSPEWFGVCSDDHFQVTVTALEECRLLVWNRDKLKLIISGDSFMQAVFDNVIGKDVVKKLLLVTETTCNGSAFEPDVALETTKLLVKMKEGKSGMDVLLSRQLDGRGNNVWNLGRIREDSHDAETTV